MEAQQRKATEIYVSGEELTMLVDLARFDCARQLLILRRPRGWDDLSDALRARNPPTVPGGGDPDKALAEATARLVVSRRMRDRLEGLKANSGGGSQYTILVDPEELDNLVRMTQSTAYTRREQIPARRGRSPKVRIITTVQLLDDTDPAWRALRVTLRSRLEEVGRQFLPAVGASR